MVSWQSHTEQQRSAQKAKMKPTLVLSSFSHHHLLQTIINTKLHKLNYTENYLSHIIKLKQTNNNIMSKQVKEKT